MQVCDASGGGGRVNTGNMNGEHSPAYSAITKEDCLARQRVQCIQLVSTQAHQTFALDAHMKISCMHMCHVVISMSSLKERYGNVYATPHHTSQDIRHARAVMPAAAAGFISNALFF